MIDTSETASYSCDLFTSLAWTIKDFSKQTNVVISPTYSSALFSPQLCRLVDFFIKLHPYGDSADSRDYLSVFITIPETVGFDLYVRFSLLDLTMTRVLSRMEKFTSRTELGYSDFAERKFVLDEANGLLSDGSLAVICEIANSEHNENFAKNEIIILERRLRVLARHEKLLLDSEFADVTFLVGAQQLRAHRHIVAECSPILRRMFVQLGRRTKPLIAIGGVDYRVMRELLRFMYAAKINDLDEIAEQLLFAAQKFKVEGAITMCEQSLRKTRGAAMIEPARRR